MTEELYCFRKKINKYDQYVQQLDKMNSYIPDHVAIKRLPGR